MKAIDSPFVGLDRGTQAHSLGAWAQPSWQSWAGARLAALGLTIGAIVALRGDVSLADAALLASVVLIVRDLGRCVAGLGSILLWIAAFSPAALPTYWICLAPWAWIWRGPPARYSARRCVVEAVTIGLAAGWLSTGFARDCVPAWAVVLYGIGCIVFAGQMAVVALTVWLLRRWPVVLAAVVSATIAALAELLQARCGSPVAWLLTSLSLPAAPAPVAQLAHYLTPFGVSGILYFCNFLCVPDWTRTGWQRWLPPLYAACVLGSAWGGGSLIASRVSLQPLAFSAMLVQPHWRTGQSSTADPWVVLDRLTRADRAARGPVDLVVWPESSLVPSAQDAQGSQTPPSEGPIDLQDFAWKVRNEYRAAGLVGVVLRRREMEIKYGLEVPHPRAYNCACVVPPSGPIGCQEKVALVPLKEGLPDWLDHSWIRNHLLPFFGFDAFLSPGTHLQLLDFTCRDGRQVSVAAPICYESYLPWLPHYRCCERADAIIHLTYDGDFANHADYAAREIWACQYRAIETRKWNLVCTSWAGSAMIDPAGRVVAQLGSFPGVLRTDIIADLNPAARN